ncbi:GNAT family N-acetyltransferase [Chryseobacterium shandongense]|uniref:GNAT family N-acetyltransferase n=1 Tax=Chryseobacterium shandongense TaxID=1493872 RepID=A0AAD0YB91_9FLAO|nr:GNAT family N-acetyltransferase [Chryseobacterium shandongense]AZA85709.1 GNAT family N-acetyltransferase [Chryseobacterium shandongense]AZA94115.1 GNAT family N-acetyltransferase [Chryseobacterium shandongense]
MTSIVLKKASAGDLETLQQIGKETFYETFAKHNSEEEMQKYLAESFSSEKLLKELNTPDSQFFIVWEEENPVGYLKINFGASQTELQDETSMEIERIYVKSSHHGKKVGQLLYDKALEIALQQQKKYIWLGVWEENKRAVSFYSKNGFTQFDKHIFRLGDEEQTDLMMKKVLE